jgi:serine protease AprX
MKLETPRRPLLTSTDDRVDESREWERPSPRVAARRRFAVPVALGAAVAFALTGMAALGVAQDAVVPALAPVEPAVAAADLPPGAMYHVVDQIGARELWAQGVTGKGVNVAVIDTGIAPVESLTGDGKVVAAVDFTADSSSAAPYVDVNGHGTFIAGILAGREPGADPAAAAEHPEMFLGVAPDAGIVSVKVDDGIGDADPVDVISGINWVVDHADELQIGVINLSYDSGLAGTYVNDPLAAAVERAWNAGIVVVSAAGNDGTASGGLASPAHDPFVIAVAGADVSADGIAVADWSSAGDGVRNPDITAPGAHINSLRAPGSFIDVNHPEGFVDGETFRGSGTSEATAVMAGAAALVRQAHPDWSPDQVKAALTATATPIDGATAQRVGSGFVDVAAAAAVATPAGTQTFAPATIPTNQTVSAGISTISNGPTWDSTSWVSTSWVSTSWVSTSWVSTSWVSTSWVSTSWVSTSWVSTSWVSTSWVSTSWVSTSWVSTSWVSTSWVSTSWVSTSWVSTSWV